MAGSRFTTIAGKELFDHLRSRTFLLMFGILLIVAIVGMIGGISEYNKNLDRYNQHQSETTSPLSSYMPTKPSILAIFSSVATYLVFVGGILGIAMGFDLVSKEKESKSLKILLSHPVYRDEVINGKAAGGIAALCGALVVVLITALATLLIFGIVPDADELVLIGIFIAVSFLLMVSYFAIALFMSTALEDSGSALIYTIIIFILLSILVPTLANDTVMENLVGKEPELPQQLLDQMIRPVNLTDTTKTAAVRITTDTRDAAWEEFNRKMQAYWEKRQMVHDTFALFSPSMNYQSVITTITSVPVNSGTVMYGGGLGVTSSVTITGGEQTDTAGLFGRIVPNLVALLLFPVIFFGLAYMKFMRLDVR